MNQDTDKDNYRRIFERLRTYTWIDTYFTHPTKVCMGYFQHMSFSLYICKRLLQGSIQALAHAFYPDWFVTSSSDLVLELTREMSQVGCIDN